MNFLIDTHVLIWSISESDKLSETARNILEYSDHAIYVSAISFWEISLKHSLGKLKLEGIQPESIPLYCEKMNFEIIPIEADICASYHLLKADYHKDPFDRMLIWQAMKYQYALVSADPQIKLYQSEGVLVIW